MNERKLVGISVRVALGHFILALVITGCAWDHIHNPSNASAISADATSFNGLTATNSLSQIIVDTAAQTSLIAQNDSLREKLHEVYSGYAAQDKSWLGLKVSMWRDFGMTNLGADFDTAESRGIIISNLESIISTNDNHVLSNIDVRIKKVQAIGKVLQTLAEGQAALTRGAANQASNSLDNLVKLTNNVLKTSVANAATNSQTGTTVADVFSIFQSDVLAAGQQMKSNAVLQTKATALQKLILEQAEASRDPASSYALVALVGAGLTDADTALLDSFLTNLSARVVANAKNAAASKTKGGVGANSANGNGSSRPSSIPSLAPVPGKQTTSIIKTTSNDDIYSFLHSQLVVSPESPAFAPLQTVTKATQAAAFKIKGLDGTANLSTEEIQFSNSWFQANALLFEAYHRHQLNVVKAAAPGAAPTVEKFTTNALDAPTQAANALEVTLPSIDAAVKDVASAAKDLQGYITGIKGVVEDTNTAKQLAAAFSDVGSLNSTNYMTVLLNTAALDPAVGKFLNQSLPMSNLVGQVIKIFGDKKAEAAAAGTRLMSFFMSLSQIQTSLYQENARHYTVFGGISSKEIQRWQWISDVYSNSMLLSEDVTDIDWAGRLAKGPRKASFLLLEPVSIKAFQTNYQTNVISSGQTNNPYANDWINEYSIPIIHPTDRIYPSLRLLLETATHYQTASPRVFDPVGWNTEVALWRLDQAIELVLNATFIVNYNRRQSDTLSRLLVAEISQHSATLDSIELQTAEANIRLQLANSQAFHNLGFTSADAQAIITILQQAPLWKIGTH